MRTQSQEITRSTLPLSELPSFVHFFSSYRSIRKPCLSCYIMKCFAFILVTAGSLALASDDRDLIGSVWTHPETSSFSKRRSSWNPPSALVEPLQEVWDHQIETYNGGDLYGSKNYGYDIINAAQGCVFCNQRRKVSETLIRRF
jgi:hypothetical protein